MGTGVADAGSIFDVVKKGFEAAGVAVDKMRSVVEALNGARSVVVTVANNTSRDIQLIRTHHDHGNFSMPAPGVVKSREALVFGSQNTKGSIGTGTEGSVTYGFNGLEATFKWDNPFIGENSADANLAGPDTNAFRIVMQSGAGNEKAQFRFDLFEIEMGRFHVFGAILDKWAAFRWGAGPLRFPTSDEIPTFDGVGRFRNFEGGTISWHPQTGANVVWGLIGERWKAIGREQFGYPITDELPTPDGRGRFNHFRAVQIAGKPEASIYWTPETGAHEVYGAIRAKWAELGWERSRLGYPVTAEQDQGGGRLQRFQRGALFWTPQGGVVVR